MKSISLSNKKYHQLEKLMLSREILNTEGHVYNFNYKGNEKILKTLFHQEGTMFANKLYTIEMLNSNSGFLPDNFICPDYLVSVLNNIIGFTVPFVNGVNLSSILIDGKILPKEQIYYLKKVGEILEQLKNIRKYTPLKDIFINDLHDSNFIVNQNNRQLYVIDLDSCKISSNQNFPSRFLTPVALLNNVKSKYKINPSNNSFGYVEADENSDLYCYIIMILIYLYGKNINNMNIADFYEYLNYLEYVKIDKNLLDCFNRIVVNAKNKNPVNYLDTITSEQVYKAREVCYKTLKKNIDSNF